MRTKVGYLGAGFEYFAPQFTHWSYQTLQISYQDRTRRVLSIPLVTFFFIYNPFFLEKIENTSKTNKQKIKHFQYIVLGFAYRLYQKLKTLYQDRIRRALSNAYLCCSILQNVGVDVGEDEGWSASHIRILKSRATKVCIR